MQECNCTVRHGGSLLHTIPMTGVTPAEILILRRIHGEDAVVDIRPIRMAKTRQEVEWARLAEKYDRASSFTSAPGEENQPLMARMFPGAVHRLPVSLKEIGLGHLMSPASIKAAEEADRSSKPPVEGEEDIDLTDENGEPPVVEEPPKENG